MAEPEHPRFDKEKGEGSRETVDEALPKDERPRTEASRGPGITNLPMEEEQDEQANLPPRGEAKERPPDQDR